MNRSRRRFLIGTITLGGGASILGYQLGILGSPQSPVRCSKAVWGRELITSVFSAKVPAQLPRDRKTALRSSFALNETYIEYNEPARSGNASLQLRGNYSINEIAERIRTHLQVEPINVSTISLGRFMGLNGPKTPLDGHILPRRVELLNHVITQENMSLPTVCGFPENIISATEVSDVKTARIERMLGGRGAVEVFWPADAYPTSSPRRWDGPGEQQLLVPPDEEGPEVTLVSTKGFADGYLRQAYDPTSVELIERNNGWGVALDFNTRQYSDFLDYVKSSSDADIPVVGIALDGTKYAERPLTRKERNMIAGDGEGTAEFSSTWLPMANHAYAVRAYLSTKAVAATELEFSSC